MGTVVSYMPHNHSKRRIYGVHFDRYDGQIIIGGSGLERITPTVKLPDDLFEMGD
ncbi:MAG: hypothetical protein GWN40_08065 [Nitrosopumilaceae archaeon]|nr:hypothetical protein [Nitrosopumilaceae archaeon]